MNLNKPFFSVIIPVHNKEPHVSRAIKSVLNQSFNDFELLIVDDASTDNSLEKIKQFDDSRIQLFYRTQPGPGGYAARNLALQESKGKWAAFLDADDEWYGNHLETMHGLTLLQPDLFFLSSGWENINGRRHSTNNYFRKNSRKGNHLVSLDDYLKNCIKNRRPVFTGVACIRVASPMTRDLFPECIVLRGGDTHAWLNLMSYHRVMGWSAHVGAKYHRDSINMVTKTAPALPTLMNEETFIELAGELDKKEKYLLRSFFNLRLRDSWVVNIKNGHSNFNLLENTHREGSFFSVLVNVFLSVTPTYLIRSMIRIKRFLFK